MNIGELLDSQARSQLQRFGKPLGDFTPYERIDFIRTQLLAALDELHEALHETGWKPWRTEGYAEVNRGAYLHELADVLVFIANLAVAVGATGDELHQVLTEVQAKNELRMASGY